MYPSPGLEACMLSGVRVLVLTYWCSGKRVNFGLEISMTSQHLPFRKCADIHSCHSDLFLSQKWSDICPTQTQHHRTFCQFVRRPCKRYSKACTIYSLECHFCFSIKIQTSDWCGYLQKNLPDWSIDWMHHTNLLFQMYNFYANKIYIGIDW
jgi:hypothetical protein